MKNIILTFTAALFLFACGTEASTEATCDKDCKKENCEQERKNVNMVTKSAQKNVETSMTKNVETTVKKNVALTK